MHAATLVLLAACSITTAPSKLEVPPGCVSLASTVDRARLMEDVTTLARAPRASEARRAEVRAWLLAELAAAGVTATEQPFTVSGQSGTNITAGSGPVLVAAHYDSVAATPGADDNATGVAVTLAVARAFGDRARYAFFDVEEPRPATVGKEGRNYAFGSQAYADALADGEVRVALVLESVGYGCDDCQRAPEGMSERLVPRDGRGLYLVGDSEARPLWEDLTTAYQRGAQAPLTVYRVVLDNTRWVPQTRFSDNAPLLDRGIDTLLVTDTALLRNPNYHGASDTPETLDPAYLSAVAQGTVAAVGTLLRGCER